VGSVVGTLEPGKEADVIVVNGDPTVDIRATSSVALVMRAGQVIA
jgi:imidazolonepropionase-like amidohydrolase